MATALHDFPELRTEANGDTVYHLNGDDYLLLALHSSAEKKSFRTSGFSKDLSKVHSILDFAMTVNASLKKANAINLTPSQLDHEIRVMEAKVNELSSGLYKSVATLLGKANCFIPTDCIDCKVESGTQVGDLLKILSSAREKGEDSSIELESLLSRFDQARVTLSEKGAPSKPIFEVNPFRPSPQNDEDEILPYSRTGDPNRANILSAYAEHLPDATDCKHFGIFNKKTGEFEVFDKKNLQSPIERFYGLCGKKKGSDENTRRVADEKLWKEKHLTEPASTPAGAFILSNYPKNRKVPELFESEALQVHSDYIRQDQKQGDYTELRIFAVHAIPKSMDNRYAIYRNGRTPPGSNRVTNGCLNLRNRSGEMEFSQVKALLGEGCRLFVLPEEETSSFEVSGTGSNRKLEFRVDRADKNAPNDPYIYSHSDPGFLSMAYKRTDTVENVEDLLPGDVKDALSSEETEVKAILNESLKTMETNRKVYADVLTSSEFAKSVIKKHGLTRIEYGVIAKLSYAVYAEEFLSGTGGEVLKKLGQKNNSVGSRLKKRINSRGWSQALKCELGDVLRPCEDATGDDREEKISAFRSGFRPTLSRAHKQKNHIQVGIDRIEVKPGLTGIEPESSAALFTHHLAQKLAQIKQLQQDPAMAERAKRNDPMTLLLASVYGSNPVEFESSNLSEKERLTFQSLSARQKDLTLVDGKMKSRIVPLHENE